MNTLNKCGFNALFGVYAAGSEAIENAMLDEIENLKKRQRSEVLDYLLLRCHSCEPSSFDCIAFNNGIYNIETRYTPPWKMVLTLFADAAANSARLL